VGRQPPRCDNIPVVSAYVRWRYVEIASEIDCSRSAHFKGSLEWYVLSGTTEEIRSFLSCT
jgi:hypothetical protein